MSPYGRHPSPAPPRAQRGNLACALDRCAALTPDWSYSASANFRAKSGQSFSQAWGRRMLQLIPTLQQTKSYFAREFCAFMLSMMLADNDGHGARRLNRVAGARRQYENQHPARSDRRNGRRITDRRCVRGSQCGDWGFWGCCLSFGVN
jgi:hypothetical protein